MSDEEKELELISKIINLMSECKENLEDGMREGVFTEEQCAPVMGSLPQAKEGLIARKNELQELIYSAQAHENTVQLK